MRAREQRTSPENSPSIAGVKKPRWRGTGLSRLPDESPSWIVSCHTRQHGCWRPFLRVAKIEATDIEVPKTGTSEDGDIMCRRVGDIVLRRKPRSLALPGDCDGKNSPSAVSLHLQFRVCATTAARRRESLRRRTGNRI